MKVVGDEYRLVKECAEYLDCRRAFDCSNQVYVLLAIGIVLIWLIAGCAWNSRKPCEVYIWRTVTLSIALRNMTLVAGEDRLMPSIWVSGINVSRFDAFVRMSSGR